LNKVLLKQTKDGEHDKRECERAMHFFEEALATGYKEYQMLYSLYMGRAKLNMLLANFGKCKEDALEALKIRQDDESLWLVLIRSRYLLEKWQEGMKYINQALEKIPKSEKIHKMKVLMQEGIDYEQRCMKQVELIQQSKEDQKMKIYRDLRSKKVKIGKKVHYMPEAYEQKIYQDDDGCLHFPVLILYDEFMQTDFI
jgi:tetratricopeptide (TPR) repeat protein